jgi:putative NADH-flavin reductase
MKVVVFGASGRTGQHILTKSVEHDHQVTAVTRDPKGFPSGHATVSVVRGDVTQPPEVASAVAGQDAVLVALGSTTMLKRDPTLVEGMGNIVAAMEDAGVERLVYLSFLGVRDGQSQLSVLGRYLAAPLILRNVVADHEEKGKLIRDSGLAWTIVRAPRLTNGPAGRSYRVGEQITANTIVPTFSRADVAGFMVGVLVRDEYISKTPAIMY